MCIDLCAKSVNWFCTNNIKSCIYHKWGECCKFECLVPTKVGIGEESSNQGSQIRGSKEDIDYHGCSNGLHVEDGGEVQQEVWQGTNRS